MITGEPPYRFVLHVRDSIYSRELDSALKSMGMRVLKTPFEAPQANAFCERLVGTLRRECLDFFLPLNEKHLRRALKEWVTHYNRGHPHSSLDPGIPEPRDRGAVTPVSGHRTPDDYQVVADPVLDGLHHEYRLEKAVA